MSGNSDNNSVSPPKGFFKRMLSPEQGRGIKKADVRTEVRQMDMKQKPGFAVSNEASVTPGRTARPHDAVMSPAVKQLNRDGYEIYNTPEKQDIYITIQPETAFFDDEEPKMVRMAGGSFVGADRHGSHIAVPVRSEPEAESVPYVQPADIFYNARRREVFGEIDFNELIIKKNEPLGTETRESPVFYRPASYDGVPERVTERSFKIGAGGTAMAETSSADVKIEIKEISPIICKEEPEYEVVETPVDGPYVTEVPAGLYVDGHRPADAAKTDAGKTFVPSFIGVMKAEAAVTSVPAPVEDVAVMLQPPAAEEAVPVEKAANGMPKEEASKTVTCVPAQIEVFDPVADIMKITIPSLHMSDDLMAEFAQGWEKAIPEDGLEAYDCVFRPMKAPAKEEAAPCAASSAAGGRRSSAKPDPYFNFRVD